MTDHEPLVDIKQARSTVQELMPQLIQDLLDLVAIPSCAFPGEPEGPVRQAAEHVSLLLRRAGVKDARLEEIPGGSPLVMGELPGPEGAPVVLLYAHYDVQPAPAEQKWDSNPWQPTLKHDGRIYGRGAADDKSGIIAHIGTARAFAGDPPVTLRFLLEGEEEIGSPHFEDAVRARSAFVQADAVIICDSGNQSVGQPTITTALRGIASCRVTVETLDRAGHSGLFGGAAPDALHHLLRILNTLHDDNGDVAVPALHSFDWEGADVDERQFRTDAGILGEAPLMGTGSLASRLWSRPAITVIGMDVPPVSGSPNAVVPSASAKVSMRTAPGSDPANELDVLMQHLRQQAPAGVHVTVEPLEQAPAWQASEEPGAAHDVATLAFEALSDAYGRSSNTMGSGGSIPAVSLFAELCPSIAPILWGCEDMAEARIHAANESVDPGEIEHIVLAQVLFARKLAQTRV